MISTQDGSRRWFALFVEPSHESIIADLLSEAGYDAYLPLYRRTFRMRGERKTMNLPLFSRYVFCRLTSRVNMKIVSMGLPVKFIGFDGVDGWIEDREIELVRRITESTLNFAPFEGLAVGSRVRVIDGSLAGVEGILMEKKNGENGEARRIVVSISLLQRSVAVEIDTDHVELIKEC